MTDFWTEKVERKARKAHRCIWCGESIAQGELYAFQSGRFYDEFQSNRWHRECFDGADWDDVSDGFVPYDGERPARPEGVAL